MVFHGDIYYQTFVDLLKDVHERFDCIIHCYCLMGNLFSGKQTPSIIGEARFKQWVFDKILEEDDIALKSKIVAQDIKFIDIVRILSEFFKTSIDDIVDSKIRLKKKKTSHVK